MDTSEISFKVKGAGFYRAGANGNTVSMEQFHKPKMKVFSGQMTAIVQTNETPGTITLEATSSKLKSGKLVLTSESK